MKLSILSNFDMLRPYEEQLWRLGALAERYFTEDPNTSLLKLRQFSELLAQSLAARAQAQRLPPLVLAKAFRGELVPQDPNDEPASALLARIASSHTAVAGKNNKKVPVARKEHAQTAINL